MPEPCLRSSHPLTALHHPLHQMCKRNRECQRGEWSLSPLSPSRAPDGELLGKGGFSHIPELLKHSPTQDAPKPIPQEHTGSRARGRTPGQPFAWRTALETESQPTARRAASVALTAQHVLLMFRCANQPADAFNTLAF